MNMYDIVGDIHGHYDLLLKLLKELGYQKDGEIYKHPQRKIIFTGDIINRGPKIRATVSLIRKMVESGNAFCILGNHELNAILHSTFDKNGKLLRKRLARYQLPLMKTLEEYELHQNEYKEVIKWFRTLPIYIDFNDFRVVHGAWNDEYISIYHKYLAGENKLRKSFLKDYINIPELTTAINGLIKGAEFQLPKDFLLKDSKGIVRRNFRIKWWEPAEGKTFKDVSFGNNFDLPAYTIPKEILPVITSYPITAPPVFLGHYCLKKKALIFQNNICCIDTCVIKSQKLTCYRWNGEKVLSKENLIRV